MNAITYRKALLEDVPELVRNRIQFAIELTGKQPPDAVETLRLQMTHYFTKAIHNNTCISFLAECNGEIAGIGSVQIREQPGNFKNPSGKWGYIMNMYTPVKFRRKGICRTILSELINAASAIGVTAFELHATSAGEKVYEQCDFNIHNEPTYRKFI